MRGKLLWGLTLWGLVFGGAGCSVSPPEWVSLEHSVVIHRHPATGRLKEQVILRGEFRDEDGEDDLLQLRVFHEKTGLEWEIPAAELQKEFCLAMPDGKSLPPGRYRAEIQDTGLRSSEREFYLNPRRSLQKIPAVDSRGRLKAPGDTSLRYYDAAGRFIRTRRLSPGALVPDTFRQGKNNLLVYQVPGKKLFYTSGPWPDSY